MSNTLDLDPDGGDIDLLEEVEEAFGVTITDGDARHCWTVGDLYKVICAHTPNWDQQGGTCASSMVFYCLRRALSPPTKNAVTPRSPLDLTGTSASRLFKALRRETGLRLPALRQTIIGVFGGWVCLLGFIGGVVALSNGAFVLSGVGAFSVVLGVLLLRIDPCRLPEGVSTVGDLVRRTAPLNARKLAQEGARPSDRWSVLLALAAEHGSLRAEEIGPETFLLHKGMEVATARG